MSTDTELVDSVSCNKIMKIHGFIYLRTLIALFRLNPVQARQKDNIIAFGRKNRAAAISKDSTFNQNNNRQHYIRQPGRQGNPANSIHNCICPFRSRNYQKRNDQSGTRHYRNDHPDIRSPERIDHVHIQRRDKRNEQARNSTTAQVKYKPAKSHWNRIGQIAFMHAREQHKERKAIQSGKGKRCSQILAQD